jgi:Glycosyl transferase family 2
VSTPPAARGDAAPLDLTVVIPAYQRERTIGRAVLSALAQVPRPALDVLVVDDGSTDGTAAAARATGARVVQQANAGVGSARNRGLAEATTTWVAFLDSDDEWLPHHLDTLLARAGDHVLVGSLARAVPSGRLVGAPASAPVVLTPPSLIWPEVPISPTTSMVRRADALAVGGFADLALSEDLEFWVRLLGRGSGLLVPVVTAVYFEHPGQVSADAPGMRRSRADVVRAFSAAPWYQARLGHDVAAAGAWDELRSAQRHRDARAALAALGVLARTPGAPRALWQTLRHRAAVRRA